jgi:hypothetical protein
MLSHTSLRLLGTCWNYDRPYASGPRACGCLCSNERNKAKLSPKAEYLGGEAKLSFPLWVLLRLSRIPGIEFQFPLVQHF